MHTARVAGLLPAFLVVYAGGSSGAAHAQDSLDEITVTGTRIRRDDYSATTATQTITAEDMERLGLVSAADMISQLPSNVGTYSLDTTGEGAWFVGATLANLRGMNTSRGTRTLVLVDGRRQVSTTNGGGVDLSFVPSILIGRMETVTGGASATYGSDATAGVVNILLDRNVQGLRLDASYGQNGDGHFKNYSVSVASGVRVLDGRGTVTASFERQVTEPVASCAEVMDWCRRSMTQLRTVQGNLGCGFGGCPPLTEIPVENRLFPEESYPEFQIFEDMRRLHHGTTYGSLHTSGAHTLDPTTGTFWQFTPDGSRLVPYQESLESPWREYAYGSSTRNVQGGEGPLLTEDNVMRNGQERDNLFVRFNWDVNDDIRLNATVRYGVTEGETFQNRATTHQDNLCIYLPARDPAGTIVNDGDFVSLGRNFGPPNGFLDPRAPNPIDADTMQILMDRGRNDANTNNINCAVGPGGFGGTAGQVFQPRPGFQLQKNWRDQIDRRVATDTDQKSVSLSANGPLLGSDRWTWDAHLQVGGSDREQALYNNQTNFRFAMALDAVYDPTVDRVVCRVNADASVGGEENRTQYRNFILGEQAADVALLPPEVVAAAEAQIDALRNGCQPINPFGLGYAPGNAEDEARQRAALAYAWDDMIEYTYSDQTIFSGSVSGDFWKGFGAGPLSMAAGIEYRDNETRNAVGGDPNVYVRTDFGTQYGDPWNGLTKASEMFAEFELPLIRDRVGAQSMSVNFTGRRTHNETSRRGSDATRFLQENDRNNFKRERDGNSWRASLVWSPVSWLRIRSTRSADIRSPSSRELFFSNTGQSGGFGFSNLLNPWRAEDAEPTGEQYSTIRGSNPNLQNEQSTTETLGLIFSPRGFARGLRLSFDYSEITVKGGISYLNDGFSTATSDPDNEQNLPYTIYRCYEFDEPYYCSQIQFNPYGSPEMPSDPDNPIPCEPRQPCAARADIVAVTDVPENSEPYWTRVVDLSASYSFNMDGGGSIAVRMLATRALEQSRCTNQIRDVDGNAVCESRENVVGVTGGARNNSFFNFSPQPKWSGNVYASYSRGPLAITGQARYTGKGFIAFNPIGPEEPGWAPNLTGTYSINELPSWTTWNLTTSYNFARSRFAPERMQNLQLSLTIDNLFDKQPDFYSGGGVGGVNRRFFNGNGRTFRLNLRTAFN